jgi:hypothetical protein
MGIFVTIVNGAIWRVNLIVHCSYILVQSPSKTTAYLNSILILHNSLHTFRHLLKLIFHIVILLGS